MTEEKKPAEKKDTDWASIQLHYRAGKRSLEDIGKEFGVSKGRISQVAKKDGWIRAPRALDDRPVDRAVAAEVPSSGFVYVIFVTAEGRRYCKIGMTINLPERIASHQCGCPLELKVACCYFVGDMRREERDLHAAFYDKRVRGEWFELTDDDLSSIAERSLLV